MTDLVQRLQERKLTVAVAESLTGGLLCNRFARLPDASDWFRGGVVAYSSHVKRALLDIGDAPVVSEKAARSMAKAVAHLLGADLAVAVTGVGGPGPEDGVPAGTVWIAVHMNGREEAACHLLDGDPTRIVARTCELAVEAVASSLRRREV